MCPWQGIDIPAAAGLSHASRGDIMETQARIDDIGRFEGRTVKLSGWLYNRRSSGKIHFLQLRDGTGIVQCVAGIKDVSTEVFELAGTLTQESSIIITGEVRKDDRAPGGYELTMKDLELVHLAQEYPISPKEHGVDFLMDHRHLWLRSKKQNAIMRVRAEIISAIRNYLDSNGFVMLDAPIFTPAACEGTTTLFETEYFDSKAYLSQSGQLYNEAGAMAFGKVYCFGPTFRAEKSKTRRHLTEFWMVEPEVAYLDLDGNMDLAEDFIVAIVSQVLEHRQKELEVLERDISKLECIKKPFPRISYTDAVDLLNKSGIKKEWGGDFGAEEETEISKHFDVPVMVHRYPSEVKAFYMKKDPGDERLSLCVDMLASEGYGEIIGGGQREDDYDTLRSAILKHGLPEEAFGWYLDLRRYGSVPHSGFGLGVERTVAWICGRHHIRECIPFPRLMTRLIP